MTEMCFFRLLTRPSILKNSLFSFCLLTYILLPRLRLDPANSGRGAHAGNGPLACRGNDLHAAAGTVARGEHAFEAHLLVPLHNETAPVIGMTAGLHDEARHGRGAHGNEDTAPAGHFRPFDTLPHP